MHIHSRLAALVLVATFCGGCASLPRAATDPSPGATASTIRHVVLITLSDHDQAAALMSDMDATLPMIEGVASYWRGSPHLSNRPEVSGEYDVGLVIDFRDEHACANYVDDPRHVALLGRWKPLVKALVIHDIASHATVPGRSPR